MTTIKNIHETNLTVKKKLDDTGKYSYFINFGSSYPEIVCDGVISLGPDQ